MTSIFSNLTSFLGFVFGEWLNDVLVSIGTDPVLFLFVVAVPLVGIAIGIFNRLKVA